MKSSRNTFFGFIVILGVLGFLMYGPHKKVVAAEDKHNHEEHGAHEGEEENESDEGHDHAGHDDHEDEHGEEGIISLSEESQKLGNIKVMPIEFAPLEQKILVNGRIAQDVETVSHVHPKKSGKIKERLVTLGQAVSKGDTLCVVASDSNEIMPIAAPTSGTVIAEFIKTGDHVDSTNALYTIADMTQLSANFDVYEKDLAHVKLGQKMMVFPMTYPDRYFPAEVVFISPRVDESTFTTRIKALVDNPTQLLKLGMSVRGEIEISNDSSYLKVPFEAVQSVEGKDVVFVQTDDETFERREVVVKFRTSKEAAIAGELKKEDRVVVEGAFILKSKLLESEMEHAHDH